MIFLYLVFEILDNHFFPLKVKNERRMSNRQKLLGNHRNLVTFVYDMGVG